jgi:hypothetical protein
MIEIFLSTQEGREGLAFHQFEKRFISICHSHHKDNRALAFAFILYDFNHPAVIKVLRDDDYWNALNEISGKLLTVFSFHVVKKRRCSPGQTTSNENFQMPRRFIESQFDGELLREWPSVLFFQVADNRITDSCAVLIRSKTIEETSIEIQNVLADAAESIKKVQAEYRDNTTEIFNLIKNKLSQKKQITFVANVLKNLVSVKELVNTLTEN